MDKINLMKVKINNEEIFVDNNEYFYLSKLSDNILSNEWDKITDINIKILALFTIKKYNDAWDLMNNNVNIIDYDKIRNSIYFKYIESISCEDFLKKYSLMTNDKQYLYHRDMVTQKMTPEIWDECIEKNDCKNFLDICKLINEIYNDMSNEYYFEGPIFTVSRDDNNYVLDLMNKYLKDDEILDSIISGNIYTFSFSNDILYRLIKDNHFNNIDHVLYYISQTIESDIYNNEWNEFWDFIISDNYMNDNIIDTFKSSNERVLLSLLLYINNNNTIITDDILKMIINHHSSPFFIETILKTLNLKDIVISHYLYDHNMKLATLYNMTGMNTTDYEFLSFIQNKSFCIYNKKTNHVIFKDSMYNANEFADLKMWQEFIDDDEYKYHQMSDFEKSLLNIANDDFIIFKELMYSICSLVEKIKK